MENSKGYENLIPANERSKDEVRDIGRKGGIASGEARRRKRDLRMAMEALLEKEHKDSNGNVITGAELLALKQYRKALDGDTRAFEVVRDTAGQKPVERFVMAEIDQETVDEVEAMMLGDDDE